MKGGEKMRAIDILLNEIDKINSQIKLEEATYKKVLLALKIRKIVNIIEDMDKLQIEKGQGYICENFYYIEKNIY